MSRGIRLTGTLRVTPDRASAVAAALPLHIALTRAEPGCLVFEVTQDARDPCLYHVAERFVDRAAFEAHQTRSAASEWAEITRGLVRDFHITEDPE